MKEKALFLRFPRHVVAIEDNTSLHLWYLQAFNDSHMLMSTLGAKNEDLTMKLLESLRKYVRYELSFEFLPSAMGCQGTTNTNKQTNNPMNKRNQEKKWEPCNDNILPTPRK